MAHTCEQSRMLLELGRVVIPPYFWGSLLFQARKFGSSPLLRRQVHLGEVVALCLVELQAVSPGWDHEGTPNKQDLSRNLQSRSKWTWTVPRVLSFPIPPEALTGDLTEIAP